MELKDIVAIAGQSGLHKIVGRSKNGLIVETIGTGRRFATSLQDKVSVLDDISIYTLEEDLRLNKVLIKLNESDNVPAAKEDLKTVRKFLVDTINLDSERVYDNDIKKLMTWFHILKDTIDFAKLAESDEVAETADDSNASVAADASDEEAKPKKAPAKKAVTPKTAIPKSAAPKANSKGAGGSKTTYRSKTV